MRNFQVQMDFWSFQIGLDPAFPLYMFVDPLSRLSVDAAEFVDIIHTDGGVLGYPWPLGHADFYPNQGILQPGCASIVGKSKIYWPFEMVHFQNPRTIQNENCNFWSVNFLWPHASIAKK